MPRTINIDPQIGGLAISKSTGAIGSSDPFWSSVKLLHTGQGTNGAITFSDSSSNAVTIGRGGSATLSNSPTAGKWGGTGLLLSMATNDYIARTAGGTVSGSTGDYVIEAWVYLNSYTPGGAFLFDPRSADNQPNPTLFFTAAGVITLFENNATQITGSTVSLSTWTYIALARNSGSTRLYVAGTQQGSTYADTNDWTTTGFRIGYAYNSSGNPLDALISDFRVTTGTSRGYSGSTITVPSAAFPAF